MAVDFTPRPTEYKGVVYRSKSEAMFARFLELQVSGRRLGGFCYEPNEMEIDGWIPDFLGWSLSKRSNRPCITYSLFEYKPKTPTATYLESLAKKIHRIVDAAEALPAYCGVSLSVFCGGFFGPAVFLSPTKLAPRCWRFQQEVIDDWLPADVLQTIKQTRFDLEN
jgi:hypothetical protein